MKIVLCIASRGRPNLLKKTVAETLQNIALDDTRIVIALDDDDSESRELVFEDPRVKVTVAKRENTLGAKYNRAHACEKGDLFINGVDDVSLREFGWDRKVARAFDEQFEADGYGLVFIGKPSYQSCLPALIGVSQKMIDRAGFYMPPYFPFWWHDTYWFEISQFTGRVVWIDCDIAHYEGAPKTQRLRDVAFWATLFDLMRGWRAAAAIEMVRDMAIPIEAKHAIMRQMGETSKKLFALNANLRDYFGATMLESKISDSIKKDRGYDAAKRRGEKLFGELATDECVAEKQADKAA